MSICNVCNVEVNDYNSILFPERDLNSTKVYRQCFYCSDSLVDLFNKGNITKFILKRKIGLKNCKQY